MVNKGRKLIRERTRLIKRQNPQVVDFRAMRKARSIRTAYWKLKKKGTRKTTESETAEKKKKKEKKEKEPEFEVIDEELEDIYSLDDEDLDE